MLGIYAAAVGVLIIMIAVNLWRRRAQAQAPLISPPKRKKRKKKRAAKAAPPALGAPTGSIVDDLAAIGAALEDPTVKPPDEVAALVALMRNDRNPRSKHYAFAHAVLRAHVTSARLAALVIAARDGKIDSALRELWDRIPTPPSETYEAMPTGRAIEFGVLIRMPEPRATTEAHAIAIVERKGVLRYFTLEKSLFAAVFCEWTNELHVNHGSIAPDEEAFSSAVHDKVRQDEAN